MLNRRFKNNKQYLRIASDFFLGSKDSEQSIVNTQRKKKNPNDGHFDPKNIKYRSLLYSNLNKYKENGEEGIWVSFTGKSVYKVLFWIQETMESIIYNSTVSSNK